MSDYDQDPMGREIGVLLEQVEQGVIAEGLFEQVVSMTTQVDVNLNDQRWFLAELADIAYTAYGLDGVKQMSAVTRGQYQADTLRRYARVNRTFPRRWRSEHSDVYDLAPFSLFHSAVRRTPADRPDLARQALFMAVDNPSGELMSTRELEDMLAKGWTIEAAGVLEVRGEGVILLGDKLVADMVTRFQGRPVKASFQWDYEADEKEG